MNQEKNKMKILFIIIGGFILLSVFISVLLFSMNKKEEEKPNLNLSEISSDDVPANISFKTADGKTGFYNNDGEYIELENFEFKQASNDKEDLVTYRGEKDEYSMAIYNIDGYKNLYWAHYNNILAYLKMSYPADKFSILEINTEEDNLLIVNAVILSEKKGEFELQAGLKTTTKNIFAIVYDEYRMSLSDSEILSNGLNEEDDSTDNNTSEDKETNNDNQEVKEDIKVESDEEIINSMTEFVEEEDNE